MTTFVLVVHILIAAALVAVILLQRSEGGGLGIGGGTGGGLVSARGAADLLTRSTTWLAVAFISTSMILAVLAAAGHQSRVIDTTLARPASGGTAAPGGVPIVPTPGALPATPAAPAPAAPTAPTNGVPIAN